MARKKRKTNRVRGNTIEVDNPGYKPGHHGEKWNPQKIRAGYNKYEDPASTMYARRRISESQAAAAFKFRSYYERGGGAGAKAIDYSAVKVDGGFAPDPFGQQQADARKELAKAHKVLGGDAYRLVEFFCGQRLTIRQIVCIEYVKPTVHFERKTSGLIKNCLSTLASLWGYDTKKTR